MRAAKPLQQFFAMVMVAMCCAPFAGCRTEQRIEMPAGLAIQDVNGGVHAFDVDTASVRALIFITNDCPIANAYAPEINHIVREYSPRGVTFYLVHVDQQLSIDEARQHAQDYGYQCTVLLDPEHRLVKAMGATVTPEAAVLNADQRLVYRGRIDDRYIDFGKKRLAPTQRDFRTALDAVLDDRAVPNRRTQAIGCYIPE